MWKRRTITVNQSADDDVDYKKLILELSKINHPENIYAGRSESDIVKMLIARPLQEQHRRFASVISDSTLANAQRRET